MAQSARFDVAELLGGRKVLGAISAREDFVEAVRHGLPYASLEALTRTLGRDLGDVGAVVGIPRRTLARRKHGRLLSPGESDRLYRAAYVTHVASATLGGVEAARAWMSRENRALGGMTPLSLLDTDIGCRQVEDTLARLSHGIHS
jgi:putative toxin-antitoxin system antitoxin component (TIGR02293 family)